MTPKNLDALVARAESLLARLEARLPVPPQTPNWKQIRAARWLTDSHQLRPILRPHRVELKHLLDIDEQKQRVDANTRQFVQGRPANNVLLTGSRGTGKSSLVKAMLAKYAGKGLRLIEVDKAGLSHLPELFDRVADEPYRFILFCDDLSFAADEPGYPALKAALDGSLASPLDNVLIYATSNRRHLMPEYLAENEAARHLGEEVHPGEATEEKISLSERFGLWVSFYPMDQNAYLAIARHWAETLSGSNISASDFETEALRWALARGARSGRVAWQFARDWVGRRD
jgi:predicted AAA+ superfamily ATPase